MECPSGYSCDLVSNYCFRSDWALDSCVELSVLPDGAPGECVTGDAPRELRQLRSFVGEFL
ncbi:MAG: hypothetical protein AAF938_15445 [Myxococcota bacterium]